MHVKVQTSTGNAFILRLRKSDTIDNLRAKIQAKGFVVPILTFNGQRLEKGHMIGEYIKMPVIEVDGEDGQGAAVASSGGGAGAGKGSGDIDQQPEEQEDSSEEGDEEDEADGGDEHDEEGEPENHDDGDVQIHKKKSPLARPSRWKSRGTTQSTTSRHWSRALKASQSASSA